MKKTKEKICYLCKKPILEKPNWFFGRFDEEAHRECEDDNFEKQRKK